MPTAIAVVGIPPTTTTTATTARRRWRLALQALPCTSVWGEKSGGLGGGG
jgi:hypothetical protein